jgi:hypothetical protein
LAIFANQDSGSGFAWIKLGRGDCLRASFMDMANPSCMRAKGLQDSVRAVQNF